MKWLMIDGFQRIESWIFRSWLCRAAKLNKILQYAVKNDFALLMYSNGKSSKIALSNCSSRMLKHLKAYKKFQHKSKQDPNLMPEEQHKLQIPIIRRSRIQNLLIQ